jgi:hypothetical protein
VTGPASWLGSFVAASAERHGFTCGRVTKSLERDAWVVTLHDAVVDEYVSFTVSHRDLVRGEYAAVLRLVDYQIDLARRGVVARVTGDGG